MGVWLGPTAAPVSFIGQNDYEYTDKATASQHASSGTDWEIAFKASGTLRFRKNPGPIDVFLVGGGQDGDDGRLDGIAKAYGGAGGASGECVTATNIPAKRSTDYTITIGASSGTIDTVAFGQTALGWAGEAGGSPAWSGYDGDGADAPARNATGGASDGHYAFGVSGTLIGGSTKYGASGGGGGAARHRDTSPYSARAIRGQGGVTGGGDGGIADEDASTAANGGDATANTGSSGGGGACVITGYSQIVKGNGGAGASGIVIIRNHRGS